MCLPAGRPTASDWGDTGDIKSDIFFVAGDNFDRRESWRSSTAQQDKTRHFRMKSSYNRANVCQLVRLGRTFTLARRERHFAWTLLSDKVQSVYVNFPAKGEHFFVFFNEQMPVFWRLINYGYNQTACVSRRIISRKFSLFVKMINHTHMRAYNSAMYCKIYIARWLMIRFKILLENVGRYLHSD